MRFPFKTTDACTINLAAKNITKTGRYCKWLQEMEASGELAKADVTIHNIDTKILSFVDTPAINSRMLQKSGNGQTLVFDDEHLVPILKTKGFSPQLQMKSSVVQKFLTPMQGSKRRKQWEDGVVFAPALIPDITDGNKELAPGWAVEETAHRFLKEYRNIDADHDMMPGKGDLVESWIEENEKTWTLSDGTEMVYPAGTWYVGIDPTDPITKQRVKNGELIGISIAGNWDDLALKQVMVQPLMEDSMSAEKDSIETILYTVLTEYETESGVVVDNIHVDRGEWGEETWEEHQKKPIQKIEIQAMVKSDKLKSRKNNGKGADDMDKKDVEAIVKRLLDQKAKDAELAKSEALKDAEKKALLEKIELMGKEIEALKAGKAQDEDLNPPPLKKPDEELGQDDTPGENKAEGEDEDEDEPMDDEEKKLMKRLAEVQEQKKIQRKNSLGLGGATGDAGAYESLQTKMMKKEGKGSRRVTNPDGQ